MKKIVLLLIACTPAYMWAQCNLLDATGCECPDGSSECDLLPDMTASYDLLVDPASNPEYSGYIEVSVSTPNIGYGPLRVIPTDDFVCGLDTIHAPDGLEFCPDGSAPRQIINQRVYHKNGSEMTYYERLAGTMTYHYTHNHFHVDDWGIYTLRKAVPGVDNPLDWPIMGTGNKLSFCLEDYGSCASGGYFGFCRDTDNNVITNDGPNYGLGGGSYGCAITDQGITVGHLDIYYYYLDGMQVYLDPAICNGDYKIVVQIDPYNKFLETNDDNNVIVADYTLTEQPELLDFEKMTVIGNLNLCSGTSVELKAPPVGTTYAWSNGATTQDITVAEAGTYYCVLERDCGELYTDTVTVSVTSVSSPVAEPTVEVCEGTPALLSATADGVINWYDAPLGGTYLGSGASFSTAPVAATTTFYAENELTSVSEDNVGQPDHTGTDYSSTTYNESLIFDAIAPFTLNSVKVYTDYPGQRIIELRDATDATVLQSATVDIPTGTTVVNLGFDVPVGSGYHLGTNGDNNVDLFGDVSPQLKRSDSGIDYPYIIDNVVSINTSSIDETRYYYFYDWDVTSSFSCTSPVRTPVEAIVKVCDGIGSIDNINSLSIYPNPSSGNFDIALDINHANTVEVSITNTFGQVIISKDFGAVSGSFKMPVNLTSYGKGIYYIAVKTDGRSINKQIIVQ